MEANSESLSSERKERGSPVLPRACAAFAGTLGGFFQSGSPTDRLPTPAFRPRRVRVVSLLHAHGVDDLVAPEAETLPESAARRIGVARVRDPSDIALAKPVDCEVSERITRLVR